MKRVLIVIFCGVFAACSSAPTAQPSLTSSSAAVTSGTPSVSFDSQNQKSKANPAEAVRFAANNVASIKAGSQGEAVLNLNVVEPFHVNSNPPSEKSFIPLEVKFEDQNGIAVGKPIYPKGELKKFAFSENQPLSVYAGEISIKLPLKAQATAAKGAQTLTGKISFQPCDDEVCYRPQTVSIVLPVTIN